MNKPVHKPSMILMIVGLLFALLLPIVTYPCSIVSLVMSIKNKEEYNTKYAVILNIIALVLAVINSALGVMLQTGMIS